VTDADLGRLTERVEALRQRVEHLEETTLTTQVGHLAHEALIERVTRLEDQIEQQRRNRRQMYFLLLGSVLTFVATLAVALINHLG
jgi:hypothetical protein